MKRIFTIFFMCLFLSLSSGTSSVLAGDVDILIKKLTEKGILSASEAKELVDELKKEDEKKQSSPQKAGFEIPSWVKKIKPFGDLRLRHDTQWRSFYPGKKDTVRNRERFRLRFGLKSKITESTEVGFRLSSGNGDQNTTNASFDAHARGKDIFIDRAYVKWEPCDYFTFLGGKHKNHLFTSPITWDPDVNSEGLAETFNINLGDNADLYVNLAQWFIEERSASFDDPTLLVFQLGTAVKPAKNISLEFAIAYYDFLKLDRYNTDYLDDGEFAGDNIGFHQQMVFDGNGDLLNEFKCLELGLKMKFKKLLPMPFSAFGYYLVNMDADVKHLTSNGVAVPDSDPSDLLAYRGDDRDKGWLIGFDIGKKKEPGDLYFKYFYQVLEDYAFPAVFVDSDFHGGGTNNKGHKVSLRYMITKKIYANAAGYFTQRDDERKDKKRDEDRIQLDVVFKFP